MPRRSGSCFHSLTFWICVAIVAAVLLAVLFPRAAMATEIGGELFLRALRMLVVPLVFTSVLCGVLALGDVRRLGKPGAYAVLYYLLTTMVAVLLGITLVNLVRPGSGTVQTERLEEFGGQNARTTKRQIINHLAKATDLPAADIAEVMQPLPDGQTLSPQIRDIARGLSLMLVSDNLLAAAVRNELLPIILFAIVLGGVLTTIPQQVQTLTDVIQQTNEVMMRLVLLLMKLAPLGIFCLVAARFGTAQYEDQLLTELRQIGWYFATVVGGLAIHGGVVLPALYWLVTKRNPFRFAMGLSRALLTAFSTASSTATLPLTIQATRSAGVSREATEFVVPLGATINMDGTALYEAVAVLFIAQALGIPMGLEQQWIIALTATLAAIGAAGIPEAGLVTMLIVLGAVGLPVEYIGLILSVDWLVDRFRTAINCWGDAIGAAVVDRLAIGGDHRNPLSAASRGPQN